MEYLGEHNNWQLYKNADGFIEGFKHIGGVRNSRGVLEGAKGEKRIVTTATEIKDFMQFVTKRKKKEKKYDPYTDQNQMRIE